MRILIPLLAASSLALAGCEAGPGGSSGSGISPAGAAIVCGIGGGIIGSQIGQGSGRIVGGLVGAALGAAVCSALAGRSFENMEEGESECWVEDGRTYCMENRPESPTDECVSREPVILPDTGERAVLCELADGSFRITAGSLSARPNQTPSWPRFQCWHLFCSASATVE